MHEENRSRWYREQEQRLKRLDEIEKLADSIGHRVFEEISEQLDGLEDAEFDFALERIKNWI